MRIKITTSFLFYFLFSYSVAAETLEVLSIDYPPFTAESDAENGPLFSILRSFVDKKLPGRTIKAIFVPPARAAVLLSRGGYCLSFYPPQDNLEEFKLVPLSNEVVRLGLIRLRQSKPFVWEDLSQLKGKSVAILRPHKGGKIISDILNSGLKATYVESVSQGLLMLSKQRVDYAFGDNKTLPRLAGQIGLNKDTLQFSKTSLHETKVGINVRKSCNLGL